MSPGEQVALHVLVDLDGPWAVNAKSPDVELAKKVLLELGSVKTDVAYAQNLGNIPGRVDAASDPDFQKLKALVPIAEDLKKGSGTYLKSAEGFSAKIDQQPRGRNLAFSHQSSDFWELRDLIDHVSVGKVLPIQTIATSAQSGSLQCCMPRTHFARFEANEIDKLGLCSVNAPGSVKTSARTAGCT